jgi:hypothetical protein
MVYVESEYNGDVLTAEQIEVLAADMQARLDEMAADDLEADLHI